MLLLLTLIFLNKNCLYMKSVIGDFRDEDSRNLPFRPLANQKKVVLKQLVSDTG